MGHAARGSGDIKRVATGLIEEVVADCNMFGNASRKATCTSRCAGTSGVGVSGRGEAGRMASAMLAIDRAENSRLDRDALDRESDAVGDLTASSAWVVHSCALPGPAPWRRVSAPHGHQRRSRGLTSGFDFVPADKDKSRSLSKAECLTADGPTRRRG
jgi:hypothetical protein